MRVVLFGAAGWLGLGGAAWRLGWVCRHDLAEACLLAAASRQIGHEILHIVGTPGAERYCNVARAQTLLGLRSRGDLERFRTASHPAPDA